MKITKKAYEEIIESNRRLQAELDEAIQAKRALQAELNGSKWMETYHCKKVDELTRSKDQTEDFLLEIRKENEELGQEIDDLKRSRELLEDLISLYLKERQVKRIDNPIG